MAAFAWNVVAATDQVISSNIADDSLLAINTIVAANSSGPNAIWEVANYASTSPKSVLLKKKDGSPGRIIFFGQQGSTPNGAAVSGTATASVLYIGYSATSTVNTPDASFLSAAPLAATDYIPGTRCHCVAAGTWRFSYAEFEDGFYLLVGSFTFNGFGISGAGELIEDIEGNNVSATSCSGSSGSTAWATTVSNSGSLIPATIGASYSTGTEAGLIARVNGANRSAYRAMVLASTSTLAKMHDTANNIPYFLPIHLVFNSSDVTYAALGKMRQVAFGPACRRETVFTDPDGISAHGHHSDIAPSQSGIWFVDLEV